MHQLLFPENRELLHLFDNRSNVPHRFYDISRARFSLGTNHRRTLGDPPQSLAEISRATNKGNLEIAFINVVFFIRWRK